MRLGRQEKFILAYCLEHQGRGVHTADLLRVCYGWDYGKSAQASMSRSFRTLWRKGLVEMWNRWDESATQKLEKARDVATRARTDPEAFFVGWCKYREGLLTLLSGGKKPPPPKETPKTLMEDRCQYAQRQESYPDVRTVKVSLKPAGVEVARGLPSWGELVKR